ncbi:MAG: hypothetical protein EBS49_05955 [Verrucomicrobia bacterium]|nr:hypothetical protein [Verrucomicrobiota bacterium]
MIPHPLKIRPVALFGKLAAALLLLPVALPAGEADGGAVTGRATIQLKNASYRTDLGGMDLVLAPANLVPEIRRLRMETWRTDGLSVTRSPEGEENPVGVRIDFSDGYKNLDLKALGQAAANAATAGRHTLYAQYKSRYAVAYWLLEVEVPKKGALRIDLSETNAAEVFNRFEPKSR